MGNIFPKKGKNFHTYVESLKKRATSIEKIDGRQSQTIREGGAESRGSLNPAVELASGFYLIG
jgi:hypothetical protein